MILALTYDGCKCRGGWGAAHGLRVCPAIEYRKKSAAQRLLFFLYSIYQKPPKEPSGSLSLLLSLSLALSQRDELKQGNRSVCSC